MRRSRSASTGLPEMLVKCVPYAARWLSPRDFLRVFVDQGAPGRTARHPPHTAPLSPLLPPLHPLPPPPPYNRLAFSLRRARPLLRHTARTRVKYATRRE